MNEVDQESKEMFTELSSESKSILLGVTYEILQVEKAYDFGSQMLETLSKYLDVAVVTYMELTGDFSVVAYLSNSRLKDKIGRGRFERLLSLGTKWGRSAMGGGPLPHFEVATSMRMSRLSEISGSKASFLENIFFKTVRKFLGNKFFAYTYLLGINPSLRNALFVVQKKEEDFSDEELNLFVAISEITGRHYRHLLRAEKAEHTLEMIKQGRSEFENIAMITLKRPDLEIISISDDAIAFLNQNRNSEDLSVYGISDEMSECLTIWLDEKKSNSAADHRVVFDLNEESQLLLELWLDDQSDTLSIFISPYQEHWSRLLTPRLVEVMEGLSRGLTNKEIANELFVSARTVEKHCYAIYKTLELGGRWDAIHLAITSPIGREIGKRADR